ncbi:MAG: M24 family metallopeptidase [Nanoarchaeota archaeon]|mgnify:CR=1 FL=1
MKKLSLVNLNNEVNNFINVKSEGEIKKIRELAGFTIGCFKSMKLFINSGKTQKEIASFLKQSFLRKGDGLAFPICVTSGLELKETTASFPSDEKILNKDAIAIDAGITKDGYYSDCTRMYFLNFPEAEQNYNKLVRAHLRSIKKIKAGIFVKDVIKIYEEELENEGLPYETLEIEDLGHSIGFALHEVPLLCQKEYLNFKLKEGMIITLEPEIKFEKYRLRVEDMVLIGNKSEILTS